jgi:hypothetical protein
MEDRLKMVELPLEDTISSHIRCGTINSQIFMQKCQNFLKKQQYKSVFLNKANYNSS